MKKVASTPEESKQRLVEGNKRYVENQLASKNIGEERRKELNEQGQAPFAIIVGCSDSRVPPEIVFDQALGDLFIVRMAGNVVDAVAMASVEYAVEHLQSPLVVVLGHEKCGAVRAAVDTCCTAGESLGDSNMAKLLSLIHPSVQKAQNEGYEETLLYEAATDKNVEAVVEKLMNNETLRPLVEQGKISIVGAKYLLQSGEVVFFE
ncbi:carbonic anhydrase [Heliorestis convoluta]|uniref:Carbonic anhydrase n=1 Tax=Heliorestis convoluta TaxID=356322 RepID=A0A5Q2N3X3_9FIRM|nr:carbonic anhydrase [Heliorestis convoluta]QGG48593.1 carbonic anhydrase family protein [Heliorestis convoluta]